MELASFLLRQSTVVGARFLPLLVACLVSVECGGPTDPDGPPSVPPSIQITCPVPPQGGESIGAVPIAVNYPLPLVFHGAQPVTATCSPASGSPFPVGATTVTCTARDAQQNTASCSFPVTVTRPGLLSATRFLAFGDSMTEGSLSPCSNSTAGIQDGGFLLSDIRMIRAAVNVPTSYPTVLGGLLAGRYVTQTPVVTNVGSSGERVSDATFATNVGTIARLRSEMAAFSPHVVFLLEGVNDLNSNLLHPEVTIPAVVKGLRDLAREARLRGALDVFVATLPPQQSVQAGGCRGFSAAQIPSANDQIRTMVAAERYVLVDVYAAFGGVPGPYIGVDGLHPNQMGYQKIAQTFLETIRTRLEVPR